MEVHRWLNCPKLNVVMTNNSNYLINPQYLESIQNMTPGRYFVQETAGARKASDLIIRETILSRYQKQAVEIANAAVIYVNEWGADVKRGSNKTNRFVREGPDVEPFPRDFPSPGLLTEVVATLEQVTVAVSYKLGRQRLERDTANYYLARETRLLRAFIEQIECRANAINHNLFSQEQRIVRQYLEGAIVRIRLSEKIRARIAPKQELSCEPITKIIYPGGGTLSDNDVWKDYKAWCQEGDGYLNIEATGSTIDNIKWVSSELLEISLNGKQSTVSVTPLRQVLEPFRNEEVQVGNSAIFVGSYLAIAVLSEDSARLDPVFTMTNYLRIVNVETEEQRRRGMNRAREDDRKRVWRFK
ncbi:MAG: hypothetical protein Q9169_005665 [Polycauliona sp. 2 TL-2023]